MPELATVRRASRGTDHSLLTSLGVCALLILGYAVGLKVYGTTSMADGAVAHGVRVTADKVYADGDRVSVVLPDGDIDDLTFVSDPADYAAPLEVQVWLQKPNYTQVNRLVFAVQDLEHLTGHQRKRLILIGFVALVALFLGSAVYLNRPRRTEPD